MIIKMNGMVKEYEAAWYCEGSDVIEEWLVRQPYLHTYQVVHRAEDGTETVLATYGSFDEAFQEAIRLAEDAYYAKFMQDEPMDEESLNKWREKPLLEFYYEDPLGEELVDEELMDEEFIDLITEPPDESLEKALLELYYQEVVDKESEDEEAT